MPGHDCDHVRRLGWIGIQNGALLSKAKEAEFDVLITLDQGIPTEQTITGRRLAVLVLIPAAQSKQAVRAFASEILSALPTLVYAEVRVFNHRVNRD